MKKILQLTGFLSVFAFGTMDAQIYLTENFDGAFTGNPAAPSGWTQNRTVLLGDGIPEPTATSGEKDWEQNTNTGVGTWALAPGGIYPNAAVSGSTALFMNDYNFGSTTNAFGARRMESPTINLATSTTPYARFWFFCGYGSDRMLFRVVASNDGGTTWQPIMFVAPNADVTTFAASTPWQRINVKIPAAFKVANAKIGLEMTNTWGVQTIFIDDFSVEEFTPTTITSAGSGGWNVPATWVGGIVPNANNNVIIAATHTVQTDVNVARMQNVTVNGVFQYSTTSTTQLNQIFGDLTVSATGLYFSGNGTTGKRTYIGGNLSNSGTIDFQPGTSVAGALVWAGYSGTYSGSGIINNNRVPIVVHAAAGGVQYSNPFTISNTCALYLGTVNAANLTLGNAVASVNFLTERYNGSFNGAPTFNNTNIAQRNLSYLNPIGSQGGIYLGLSQVNVTPGDEVEIISGSRQVTGNLVMNTHNNVVLGYPLSVGTSTGTQNITLTRGIITTTTLNLLTLNSSATGAAGTTPTTFTSNGTNGGNHGSYVNGPLKINFPATGTGSRTFPLGQGNAFYTNLPSANVLRAPVLAAGGLAWNSQTITATIENTPSGVANAPINTVMGVRAYRLNMNGGPALGLNNTLQLPFNNSTFGGGDNFVGNLQDVRVIQSASLTGPWSERSLTAGTGAIVNNTNYTRVTATVAPGPINNGNEYFAFGSTALAVDAAASSLASPGTIGCYGPNQTVSFVISNAGIAPLNFAVNNATLSSAVSGAVSQAFTPVVINTGILGVGASQTVVVTTTLNMSTVGTYSFASTVTVSGDANLTNDVMTTATRTVTAALPLPYSESFNAVVGNIVPPGWTADNSSSFDFLVTNNIAEHGTGSPASRGLAGNVYSGNTTSWANSPKMGVLNTLSTLSFDYRIVNYSGYANPGGTATPITTTDSLLVKLSTNCGATFSTIAFVSASNHVVANTFTNVTYNLGAYAGSDVIVRFEAKWAAGDYYYDIDNINITSPIAVDAGAVALNAPGTTGCYSSTEPVSITIKNHGINSLTNIPVTVVVSGVINQTLNATYTGTLASTATVNLVVGNINMLAPGTYSFDAFTSLAGDGQVANDAMAQATRTVIGALALPYSQDFNASVTLPAGFTNAGTPAYSVFSNHGNTYTDNALSGNLYGTTQTISIVNMPKLGSVTANTTLKYDYRIQDWSGYPASAATSTTNWANDSLNVYVSTNCGLTFTMVQSNNASNHTASASMTTKVVNLGSFAGNDVIIRFVAKKDALGSGDYYADLDNINVCSAPVAPASNATTVCSGATATLTTVATGTAQWYATSTPTSYVASGNTFVSPTLTSNTTYYVLDSTSCGLSTLTPVTISVVAQPVLSIGASQTTVCAGSTVNIGITGATNYTWSTGSNSVSINPTVSATTNYSVVGVSGPGCSSTASVTITANANPTVNATTSASLICNGSPAVLTATGASTYSWNTSATTSTISVTPSVTTSYTVTGTTNGCSNTFVVSQAVSPCTGVNANAASVSGILVYPNPNTGEFTIELNNGSVKNIQVMDLTGRVIVSNTSSNDKIDFNINTLANGVYYVRIQSNNTVEVIKIIKQ
ncbi:MAG: T9SS type A sorting domain-containing protein [Bacteroidia bacterium]|nr:T9SS type A sorting domain-containing protein [Bacteroidia bacterium]